MNLLLTGLSLSQAIAPLFKPMIIVAFILGNPTCLALCWKRLRESRRAFSATHQQSEMWRRKAERQARALANIRDLLQRAQLDEIFDLGGKDSLPVLAKPANGAAHQPHFTYAGRMRPLDTGGRNHSRRAQ